MKFFLPKYWLTWLLIGLLFLIGQLPFGVNRAIAWVLGTIVYRLDQRHRKITHINLALCLPELDEKARKRIAMNSFRSMLFGVFILAGVWFASRSRILRRIRIDGDENIQRAFNEKKSVILVASHQSGLEIAALLGAYYPAISMYRPNPNQLLDYITRRGRQRFHKKVISRKQVRKFISETRKAQVCCIVPDQDMGMRGSIFATFFGVPAATTTLIPKIQQINAQTEILISSTTFEGKQAHMRISEPVVFQTDETMESKVTRLNELLAEQIRRFPEQYLWQHKRFKTQPDGVQSPYE